MKKQKRIEEAMICLEYMQLAWHNRWSGPLEDQLTDVWDILYNGNLTSDEFHEAWMGAFGDN